MGLRYLVEWCRIGKMAQSIAPNAIWASVIWITGFGLGDTPNAQFKQYLLAGKIENLQSH